MKCGVRSVESREFSVECGVLRVTFGVWSFDWRRCSVQGALMSL